MEALGYVGRIIAARDKTAVGPYVMQSVLLLVAPAIYAASIYVILGRLIVFLEAEHHSSIPVRWLTKLFVAGDVLSFLAQSTGMLAFTLGFYYLIHLFIQVGHFLEPQTETQTR